MTINVACLCGATTAVPDELAGRQIVCATCQKPIQVPGNAPMPTAAPQAQTGNVANPQAQYAPAQNMGVAGTAAAKSSKAVLTGVILSVVGVVAAGGGLYAINNNVKELQQRAEAADELRKGLGDALKKEKENITELQEKTKKAGQKQKDIRTKLELQNTTVARLSEQITRRQAEMNMAIAEAKQGNEDARMKADELQTMIDTLNAEATVAKADADQLATDLTAANAEIVKAQQDIVAANQTAANLQSAIDSLPPAYVDNSTITNITNPPVIPPTPSVPLPTRVVISHPRCDNITPFLAPALTATDTLVAELDTATGFVQFSSYTNANPPVFRSYISLPLPGAVPGSAGRYDMKCTEISTGANAGKIHDFVVLDTHTGRVWHSTAAGWLEITFNQQTADQGPRFVLNAFSKSETFTVTNIGAPLGANTWTNIVVAGSRLNAMSP